MIPRLRDLISKHRVILYTSCGGKFGIICNNILAAQKFVNDNIYNHGIQWIVAGYRIEKVQSNP